MKAIIPVAGKGTRLRPHTHTTPKVLLNVAGKPIIAHIMDHIPGTKIDHVVFIVGYLKEVFEEWARDRYKNLHMEFIEQKEILGLGHAVGMGLSAEDEEVMIILGDTIFEIDLDAVLSSEYSSLGVQAVKDPSRFGVVVKEDGFIVDLVEKSEHPPSHDAIVGLYFIKHGGLLKQCIDGIIADDVTTKGEYQITDALKRMVQQGEKMTTFSIQGWYDCGTALTLLESNRHLLSKQADSGADLAALRKNNIITEPVFIAPDADVKNSIIGPYTSIGPGCTIAASIIQDSIVGDDSDISSGVFERSIIGRHATIRGTANKLNISDHSEITFH
ncbi:NTP transferase domain-containing protein [bacterium]|nr:NTP transferase domain-containing protein [bacterium]